MVHELKIKTCFADSILCGEKTFEIRYNDRGYQKGDLIKFNVFEDYILKETDVEDHELNNRVYKITYVLSGYGLKEGFVALGIMPFMELNN